MKLIILFLTFEEWNRTVQDEAHKNAPIVNMFVRLQDGDNAHEEQRSN